MQNIKKLSEKQHILLRPQMYLGSIDKEEHNQYIVENEKFVKKGVTFIPALIKILNELIDNSIDEYGRTEGKFSNIININMDNEKFSIQDNGRGISNTKVDGMYQVELAWCHARAGSNFDEKGLIGQNGVGSFATNVFSKKFIGISDDGKKKIKIETKDNLEDIKITELKSSKTGVQVITYPDFEKFGIKEFDENHIKVIESRLYHLSVSYPGIKFKFNGKIIKLNSKKYFEMFGKLDVFDSKDGKYSIAIGHNDSDTFEQFSTVNGLLIPDGGTHVDVVSNEMTKRIREKLQRKYKNIKPAEIKNRLFIVEVLRDFKDPKFNSQTKEKITNSEKEIKEYFIGINFELMFKKVYKNEELVDAITEFYKIKAEMQTRAEIKKLQKNKKVKSEKYLPATRRKKVLFLCEGASAVGGLMPSLGREDFGFYELKGVPLNAYDTTHGKFTSNKELSELYQIIQTEGYELVCTATDADADGSHIKGLLLGFYQKYLPGELNQGKFGELQTPVQIALKNNKPQRWTYELGTDFQVKKGETGKYMKGLGSYKSSLLQYIVKADGIENMIKIFELDNNSILDDWLSGKKSDKRKEYIKENVFDITGI